ncbi:cold shock domain-containing protein [Amycolatopsis sp. NPDC005232]|uniref:cold shock domain-containing protein n=1 Tax=Amycolatopsis sp. NPDC005232 TaxID=3157027 RepID=UPI0033BB451B
MTDTVHTGWVVEWHGEQGWGVLDCRTLADQAWAHYSSLDVESSGNGPGGFRRLTPAAEVEFTAERAEQDGYHWRAVWVKEKPPKGSK